MSDRLDTLRSLIRAGADRARDRLEGIGPVAAVRKVIQELRRQRTIVTDRQLGSALAHAPGVEVASVSARRGALRVDATFRDGHTVAFDLMPFAARFAPRGAKEIVLQVVPPEAAGDTRVRDLVSSLAGAIAQGLWAVMLRPKPEDLHGAIVDRDGEGLLRVDLRTVPAVRKVQGKGPTALALELLELQRIVIEEGELALKVKLPPLG